MEELLIEGETYISSKRAATISGYAKDYIGQLCREGRVKARLVGRSWYVLEESLQKHRFGDDTIKPKGTQNFSEEKLPAHDGAEEGIILGETRYSTEEPKEISIENTQPRAESLKEVERAWQEWFDTKRVPAGGGESLQEGERSAKENVTTTEKSVEEDAQEDQVTLRETEAAPLRVTVLPVPEEDEFIREETPRQNEFRPKPSQHKEKRAKKRSPIMKTFSVVALSILVSGSLSFMVASGILYETLVGKESTSNSFASVIEAVSGIRVLNKQ